MGDMYPTWFLELGRTTLLLAVAAVLAAVALRLARTDSPRVHRAAWCLVLAIGWLFFRLPVAFPWYEPPAPAQSPSLSEAEPRPSGSGQHVQPTESNVAAVQYPAPGNEDTLEIGPAASSGSQTAETRPLAQIATLPAENPPAADEPRSVPPRTEAQCGQNESLWGEASTPPKTILANKAAPTSKPFVVATPPIGTTTSLSTRGGFSSSWLLGLAILWTSGMAAAVFRWLAGYVRSIRAMSTAIVPDEASCRQWHSLLAEHRIDRDIPLRLTSGMGPLLCRWPDGYELVLPAELWASLDPRARESIMRHELAHYQRGDVWKSLAVRLLALPHWFNPAAWWAVRRFDEAAEWACDEAAVVRGQRQTEFALTLLTLAETSLGGGSFHPETVG